jgi:hypothetical protein
VIKPSILEASPEECAAAWARFDEAVKAFGDGISEEEMTDEELNTLISWQIKAIGAEQRGK